jgi:hypothetical protein
LKEENEKYRKNGEKEEVKKLLGEMQTLLEEAKKLPKPNFFGLGYYIVNNPGAEINTKDIEGLNAMTHKQLDEKFMLAFLKGVEAGIKYSYDCSIEQKKKTAEVLKNALTQLETKNCDIKFYKKLIKELSEIVEQAIDRLDIDKDSYAYTFRTSLSSAMNTYVKAKMLEGKKHINKKNREFAANVKMDLYQHNIILVIQRVLEDYEAQIKKSETADFTSYGIKLVDHLKEQASKMVYKVTKSMPRTGQYL